MSSATLPPGLRQRTVSPLALMSFAIGLALSTSLAGTAQAQTDDGGRLAANLAEDTPERAPGQKSDPKTLEGGLWAESLKAEQQAKTSGERDLDPALNTYVDGVMTRLAGPYAGDLRVYVMDRPFFNAQVAPNGYAEVWTGLLLRVDTEDQLAFVLGHEFGHFRHSHVLKTYQEIKAGQNAAMAASLLIAAVGVGAEMNAGSYQAIRDINSVTNGLISVTYLGTIAALMSYSRETEADADAYGMIYARQAGWYTGGNAILWQNVMDETKASDFDKVRRGPSRINIFRDHPLDADRLTALAAQDKGFNHGAPSTRTAEETKAARIAYRAHIRPYLGAWLRDDLRRQDYGQTLFIIERLGRDGEDLGLLDFYKGEAYRLRDRDGTPDRDNAIKAYKAALTSPDAPSETWRQLGEIYRRNGDAKNAVDAFKTYLRLAPTATDAWMVQDQMDTLARTLPADAPPGSAPAAATPTSTPATGAMPAQVPASTAATQTTSSGGTT